MVLSRLPPLKVVVLFCCTSWVLQEWSERQVVERGPVPNWLEPKMTHVEHQKIVVF